MNKKGGFQITKEYFLLFIRLFLMIFVIVSISLIVNIYVNRNVETYGLEGDILVSRLLYSADCLGHETEERVYAGVVDVSFFDRKNNDKCFVFTGEDVVGIFLNDSKNLKFFYSSNEADFNLKNLKCTVDKHPNWDCYKKKLPVLYYEGNDLKNAVLEVSLIKENE